MIDLNTWNLSIPVGNPAQTIETKTLNSGYNDTYFKNNSNGTVFWVPVNGSVTKSAKYPRTELRETNSDGTLKNWKYTDSDNFLRASLSVNKVPSSGKVVIGQIHQFGSDEPLLKIEYQFKEKTQSGNIVAKLRMSPNQDDPTISTIYTDIPINKIFTYTIHLNKNGKLSISVLDQEWKTQIDSSWQGKPLYFKAGAYVQDNSGYSTEGAQVTFFRLSTSH